MKGFKGYRYLIMPYKKSGVDNTNYRYYSDSLFFKNEINS